MRKETKKGGRMKAHAVHHVHHRNNKIKLLHPGKMRRRIKSVAAVADNFIDRSANVAENAALTGENYLKELRTYAKKHPLRVLSA
jgi:hypothetical protein